MRGAKYLDAPAVNARIPMLLQGTIRNAGPPRSAAVSQTNRSGAAGNIPTALVKVRVLRLVLRTQPRSETTPDSLPRTFWLAEVGKLRRVFANRWGVPGSRGV